MGLLTKTVVIKWNPRNKNWYVNKGYNYTKMNDEFEVKVEDLTNGCHVVVDVKCDGDNCEKISQVKWQEYLKWVHEDGIYYCQYCGSTILGSKKAKKTKLLKSKSFEQWCLDNLPKVEAEKVLSRWDYDLNNCSPNEITYGSEGFSRKGYWFKCDNGRHPSELKIIAGFTREGNSNISCNKCNSFGQYLINNYGDNALNLYWSDKNTLNPMEIDRCSNKKVWIKCQEKNYHEDHLCDCFSFIRGSRCPYCATFHGKVHPLDSVGKLIEDKKLLYVWSDKNKKSSYKYTPFSIQKVWWKCENQKHEDYLRPIGESTNCNFRCPKCVQERVESFLQEKVRLYLEQTKYIILHENNCTIIPINPKTNCILPFDNEVKELKLIIEVHGQQHYEITGFHNLQAKYKNTIPEQEFHYQQLKDRYKRIKVIQQGYFYLEIPYWTDDKYESWKKLIDNKINEILNTTPK